MRASIDMAGVFTAVVNLGRFASGTRPLLGRTTPGVVRFTAPADKVVVEVVFFAKVLVVAAETEVVRFKGAFAVAATTLLFSGILDSVPVAFARLGVAFSYIHQKSPEKTIHMAGGEKQTSKSRAQVELAVDPKTYLCYRQRSRSRYCRRLTYRRKHISHVNIRY